MATPDVLAAGAVVFRSHRRVLLVHRPRYDDWSFPKGKLDRGEHIAGAAVREVAEETGLRVGLGRPLSSQRYPISGGRHKQVAYWVARASGSEDVSGYRPNDEIDEVAWVPYDEALERLTYPHDRTTLAEALPLRQRTRPLVVLRHGQARSRRGWASRDDRERPLVRRGLDQAERLVPLLAAYDVTRVVSSSSKRCVDTVAPYAAAIGRRIVTERKLSEEDATPRRVRKIVERLVAQERAAVLCTHRPVLPEVFEALGVPAVKLEPAAMLVVHLRHGKVTATEIHDVD